MRLQRILITSALIAGIAACGTDETPSFDLDIGGGQDAGGGDAGVTDTGGEDTTTDTGGEDTTTDTGGEDTTTDAGGEDTTTDTGTDTTTDTGTDTTTDTGTDTTTDTGTDTTTDAGSDTTTDVGTDTTTDTGADVTDTGADTTTDTGTDTTTDTGADTVDPCAEIETCDPETYVASCAGDVLTGCGVNPDGCFVERMTDCGAEGGTCNAETASCDLPAGVCTLAGTLDCSSGTITGNTANGTLAHDDFECTSFTYPGLGEVWEFTADTASEVQITAVRVTGTGDYDLYALDASAGCDQTATCLDSSTGTSDTETLAFLAEAGETAFIFYDLYNSTEETTEYTLTIACVGLECGDGEIASSEQCDDMNDVGGDGCDATCQIEEGYACEGSPSVCREITCGDGFADFPEACDGGEAGIEGCEDDCTVSVGYECTGNPSVCTSTCGNGTVDASEECDDNNDVDADGCTSCVVDSGYVCEEEGFLEPSVCRETVCGDGVTEGDELCDFEDPAYAGVCEDDCTFTPGLFCDPPFGNPDGYLRCYEPGCGDGNLDEGEACDMGGATSDSCDAETCTTSGSVTALGPAVVPDACIGAGGLSYAGTCDDPLVVGGDDCETSCALPLAADSRLTLSGAITADDLQFDRRSSCTGTESDVDHEADIYWLTNNTGADLELRISSDWSADGYLYAWVPGTSIASYEGCIESDDDWAGTASSWIETLVTVLNGESILVVASNFNEDITIDEYSIYVDTFTIAP